MITIVNDDGTCLSTRIRCLSNVECPAVCARTYPLAEDQFINVSGEHGTSREDATVRRGHHRS